MPAILSENLDMGAFFMREKLKQFYIVLLVFILTIMGQYYNKAAIYTPIAEKWRKRSGVDTKA